MNTYVSNELRQMSKKAAQVPDPSRELLLQALYAQKLTIDDISPEEADCVICQFSLMPKDDEPFPSEDPLRLPCGHVLGRTCALKWFSSLVKGKHHVDEDFNTTCPLCRTKLYEVNDTEQIMEDNRRMWTALATTFRQNVVKAVTTAPQADGLKVINAMGGWMKLLQHLDRLALLRWYVCRHFEKANPRKTFNPELLKQWQLRTRSGRPSLNGIDWLEVVYDRDSFAGERLDEILYPISELPKPSQWHDSICDKQPETRILRSFTNVDMMPSQIFKRLIRPFESCSTLHAEELDAIRMDLLDLVTWTIRQGRAWEDFPEIAAAMNIAT